MLNKYWESQVRLLTVHDHVHILDETIDDFENLHGGHVSLILRESVQPLQYHLDFLLSKAFLSKSRCVSS